MNCVWGSPLNGARRWMVARALILTVAFCCVSPLQLEPRPARPRLSDAAILDDLAERVVPALGWLTTDYLGIDQGPILAMIENQRSGLVWRVIRRNPYLVCGLKRAGFSGGWLGRTLNSQRTNSQLPNSW
jgi:hypothetical protein